MTTNFPNGVITSINEKSFYFIANYLDNPSAFAHHPLIQLESNAQRMHFKLYLKHLCNRFEVDKKNRNIHVMEVVNNSDHEKAILVDLENKAKKAIRLKDKRNDLKVTPKTFEKMFEQMACLESLKLHMNESYKNFKDEIIQKLIQINATMETLAFNIQHLLNIQKDKIYAMNSLNIWDAAKNGPLMALEYWIRVAPHLVNEYNPSEPVYAPLHYAVLSKEVSHLEFILENKGRIEKVTFRGNRTALHLACQTDQMEMVSILLENGCNKNAIDCDGENAVHLAVRANSIELVTHLVNNKFNCIFKNRAKQTPRMLAKALYGTDNLIFKFLKHKQ